MRKVLVIAYIFPPLGGSGVQRTLKFVKYLPQFGWEPLVVCGDDEELLETGRDESLLAEVPAGARVWRTHSVSPYGPRRKLQRLLGLGKAGARRVEPATDAPKSRGESKPGGMASRAGARRALGALAAPLAPLEFPPVDAALYWALSIVPLCRRIVAEEKIDVIYSTSFPYSDHVTGLLLKRLTGKPWVADFRDPWTQNAGRTNKGWRLRIDRRVEQMVLSRADRVIGVTPTYTENLHALVPRRPREVFATVENGFDGEDFPPHGPATRTPGDVSVLAHVGMVYEGSALPFLEALAGLGSEASRLKVRFVGGIAGEERRWLEAHRLGTEIEIVSRVPHARAVGAMQAADALLLLVGSGDGWIGHYPGKLFEYMVSGTPILMVGPEGDAARLVRESGTGCFVPADDVPAITAGLHLLTTAPDQFRARYYHPNLEVVSRYERRALTEQLAALFDQLVTGGAAA